MNGTNGSHISNQSGWKAVEFKIIVLPQEIERETKGGLILPDQTVEKEEFGRTEGIIVDASPMAFTTEEGLWPRAPQIGDRVMFSKYGATQFRGRDGRDYWLMNDKAVVAVMEKVQ